MVPGRSETYFVLIPKGSRKNKFPELAPRFRLDSESHKFAYLVAPIE